MVLAGSKRAEFRASGNSGATSPAATSSGLQAGFSAGPVKRESSSRTVTGTETPSSCRARTVDCARLARPARPSTAPGTDSPAPRSTSPPPVSTTDPGAAPATALVLKRRSGPRVRRAAAAVRSFMLEAGTRTSSPERSKRTSPVSGVLHHAGEAPGAVGLQGFVELRREGAGLRDGGRGGERFDAVRCCCRPRRHGRPVCRGPGARAERAARRFRGGRGRGRRVRRRCRRGGRAPRPAGSGAAAGGSAAAARSPGPRPRGSFCVSCCCWSFSPEMSPLVPETRASRYILNSSRRHRHCFLCVHAPGAANPLNSSRSSP